jgi:hypothetical protein
LKNKLNRQNKLIQLAYKSPGRWLTVSEYKQNDLASDEEDSKKIKRSEKAALNIIKERDEKLKSEKKHVSTRYFHYSVILLPTYLFFLPFSSRDQGLSRIFFAPIPTLIKDIRDFFKDQNPRTNALLAENSDTIVPAVNTTTSTENPMSSSKQSSTQTSSKSPLEGQSQEVNELKVEYYYFHFLCVTYKEHIEYFEIKEK